MGKDTIADLITAIRNDVMDKKRMVRVASTKITETIVNILLQEGFIENVRTHREDHKNLLVSTLQHRRNEKGRYKTILKCISRLGLRIYFHYHKIPRILGGMGIIILSTSRGIIIDQDARLERIGGEILCYIW